MSPLPMDVWPEGLPTLEDWARVFRCPPAFPPGPLPSGEPERPFVFTPTKEQRAAVPEKVRRYYLTEPVVKHTIDAGGGLGECVVNLCVETATLRASLDRLLSVASRPVYLEPEPRPRFEDLTRGGERPCGTS
jgi:hypothetical protein